jgi:hypothetical protein
MPLISTQTFTPSRSGKEAVPYLSEAMRQDLGRVRNAWRVCLANRDRNAIYRAAQGREIERARQALCLQRLEVSAREDPFAAIIRCTADPAKADKRTRSKWSRLMRYAAVYKSDTEALGQFIQRKRGINECAARFTRRLGQGAAPRPRAHRTHTT